MRQILLVAVIVGDNSVAQAAATAIRSAGFSAEIFVSVEEFIRSNRIPCTGCLVLDVQQPGMNGMQLQSHLASAGRHIPIIFINASATETARALAFELGAVDLLKASGQQILLKEIGWRLKPREGGDVAGSRSPDKADSYLRDDKL
ncbi:MAG: response regulator receiver protein [Candidatus Sulfotelmatobacter sp.]|nr:response regulator receiver protein [Candidatus Sulfotelmatobacter sp.]